jgi:uncharacterized protein YhaN
MRIDELHLTAFGPFTDQRLNFSKGREGFHMVYGLNEAGKSSALRALRNMLYGIPLRSHDDFVHPYAKMRIGATLHSSSGNVLKLIRRKGRGNTLRSGDDETVIDENVLSQFLEGIDADLFTTMFGIGYEDLVHGGQEIIQGGGNLGRLIFSAGSGIANLREIQNELELEAAALFRPSAQKPLVNEKLQQLKEQQAALRDAQLPGQEWETHHRELQQALEKKAALETNLISHQKARSRLKRIQEALPIIAQRNEFIKALTEVGVVPELPEDFSDKRRSLIMEIGIAEKEKARAADTIKLNENAAAELKVSSILLDNADFIEELHQELGSQRKAAKDCINLETERNTLRGEALEILHMLQDEVTLNDAEKLRIKKDQVVLIQELSSQYERIITRVEDLRENLPGLQQAIHQLEADLNILASPVPTQALQASLTEAESYAPLETRSQIEKTEIQSMVTSLEREQHRLGLGNKSFETIESLPVPNMETLRLFEDRFGKLEQSIKDVEKETGQTEISLRENECQMEANQLERDVPSEDDLSQIRKMRDRGLALIAKSLNQEEIPAQVLDSYLNEHPQAGTLLEVFTLHVKQADEVSDRLRREADRVAAHARLLSDQKAYKDRLARHEETMALYTDQQQALVKEWESLWQETAINFRTPKEMSQWLQAFTSMLEKMGEARSRQVREDRLAHEIDSRRQDLVQSLRSIPNFVVPKEVSLTRLIEMAAQVVDDQKKLLQRREELIRDKTKREKELAAATLRMETNEAKLEQWQKKWELAVKPIGLMADAMPSQAVAVLEDLKVLFDKLKEADILEKRIQGIYRDEAVFNARVAQLVESAASDLTGQAPNEAVMELQDRLKQSRDARSRRQTFEKQMEKEHQRLSQAKEKIASIQAELNRMCGEAACENYNELPDIEKRSRRRRKLNADLKSAEDRLRQISGGATVDEFVQEARAVDPDELANDIQLLEEKIDELLRKKSALDQIIGREQNELDKMDGSAKAAGIAEEIQFLSGSIAHAVEKYASLRIAGKVLSIAIEKYRDKSQGPILERASRLFEQITAGSFQALRAEYDSSGHPVLVGVRQGSREIVGVEGMSDGTADQLYLALRLAGMELYLENNEPMPFIVDDILIKFDNERAAAALKTLAKLSEKTQVIFFTHHRHLMALAEAHLDASILLKHTLDTAQIFTEN